MSRQQRWAAEALSIVQGYARHADRKQLATWCMRMPSLLQQCGLLQALAFARTKCEPYADDLANVYAQGLGRNREANDAALRLLELVNGSNVPAYLAMSRDVAEVSVWMRRFAQSELKAEATDAAD